MSITNDYQQQHILYRACGRTAQSSDSASALQISKYNYLREAHLLEINEWDAIARDAIDVCDRWSPKTTNNAGSGGSHRCQVRSGSSLPPWQVWHWSTPRYTRYRYGWSVEYGFGCGDMEDGITSGCFLVSLFSSLHFFSSLDLGPVQMASARVFTTSWSQSSGGGVFPVHRICRKVTLSGTDRLWDL